MVSITINRKTSITIVVNTCREATCFDLRTRQYIKIIAVLAIVSTHVHSRWYARKLPISWRRFEGFLGCSVSIPSTNVLRANVGGFVNLPRAYVYDPDSNMFKPWLLDNDDLRLDGLSI